MGNLFLILVPTVLVVVATVAYLNRSLARQASVAGGPPPEPMWATPGGFILIAVMVMAVLLLFAPRLLGLTFLIMPFLWSRGPGRRQGGGPGRPRRMDDE